MEIVLIAVAVVAATGIFFVIFDRKKNAKSLEPQENNDTNKKLLHYSVYDMPIHEKIIYILIGSSALAIIGYLFYQNAIIALLFALLGIYYPKYRKQKIIEKRKQELVGQFKQALYSLSSALSAGKSVENAFRDVVQDLQMLYSNPDTLIIKEFTYINQQVSNGETIENALEKFAARAEIEDVSNFVNVFTTSKRTGGNLKDIIRRTSNILGDKLEIEQEIRVNIAQKKFEASVLLAAPLLMILFLLMTSPDYMAPLYKVGIGTVVMTGALIVYAFSFWLVQRIMDIKV